MKKLAILIVLAAGAALMTWVVWFRPVQEPGEEKKPEAEVPVRTGTIVRTNLHAYVTGYGTVEPEPLASARIASAVPGVVAVVKCSEGQPVEKGDLLFQLDSRATDIAAAFAEKTLERQQKLTQIEGTSQKLFQEAEQGVAAAKAQQALLQVRAPFSGVITKVNTKAGEAADLTTVLAELVDTKRLVVTAAVSSSDLATLKIGEPAEAASADSTNLLQTAVLYVSQQVDPKTGAGIVRAGIPSGSGLRPGQFVKLRMTSEEHKDCLAVPLASVAKDAAGGTFVALVEEDKAVLKPVKVGLREGDWVEVEGDGIAADKVVITEGAYGLIMTQQFATKIRVVND